MRNARQEAFDRLDGRFEVRVLEPSPPAVQSPPWFADDPAARGEVPVGRELVSPVSKGDMRWSDLFDEVDGLAGWCADRWLGGYRPLAAAPASLTATREALHRLAEHVLSPARAAANGKIALRFTFRGFGTPFFGDNAQLRVEADRLIMELPGETREAEIGSLAEAAEFAGIELGEDGETPVEPRDEPLGVDPAASVFLGDWYGFTTSVLEQLRAEAGPELDASRVQLWVEHFDIAAEFGSEADGERAGYGGSPGDALHPAPYLYVVPWDQSLAVGETWNSAAFKGAELSYSQLRESDAPREIALEFFRSRLRLLASDS